MIEKIKKYLSDGKYAEALSLCEQEEKENPKLKSELVRIKAKIYSRTGDFASARTCWQELLDFGNAKISDYYLASENLIILKEYKNSISVLLDLLDLGEKNNETWFLTANLFYLSYCYAKLRNYKKAMEFYEILKSTDSNFDMPLPGEYESTTLKDLEKTVLSCREP